MTAVEDITLYLDAVFGQAEGYLHTFVGIGGHFTDSGRYDFTRTVSDHYRWPEQRRQAVAALSAAAEDSDAYACPYLMVADKRAQGAASGRPIVHADIDGEFDPARLGALGGYAVGSGSAGHAHAYLALSESVPAHWHRALCRGLGNYLGHADAKISDNDVLRPPGTVNHKGRARGGGSTPVEWLLRPDGTVWEPRALAEALGVELPAQAATDPPAGIPADAVAEHVDPEAIPPAVAHALAKDTGDRSADTMRVAGACYTAGLTLPQTRHIVGTRPDLAERLTGRTDDDVATCYHKAAASARTAVTEVGGGDGAPTAVHRGQARIAYRVARRYTDKLLHVNGIGWHVWDGARFRYDDRGAATRAVLAELRRALADSLGDADLAKDVRRCESATGVAGVLALAGALEPLSAAVADLDADPYLLNCANGTLDLHTLELRPHSPADRITKVCRGAYRPEAESAVWKEFLARILPGEDVRRFVQRLVGLGLLGAVREHVLGIWTGTGANGKSATDKAVRYALGDYAISAEPDLFMHRQGAHPTGEMDLRGVRWVVVSESERERRLAESTMKRLTGGDTIRARRMRRDFVEFTPSHTATLVTNHLPKVSGDDPAIWRRLRVVPFDVVIPPAEQDSTLDERLQLEADAILTWAVAGWRDYSAHGLAEPTGVRDATDAYRRASDALARFIAECCHTSPAVKSITGQLFDAWDRWRVADGAEPMSLKAFGVGLTEKGYDLAPATNGKRWRKGIALRADLEDGGVES